MPPARGRPSSERPLSVLSIAIPRGAEREGRPRRASTRGRVRRTPAAERSPTPRSASHPRLSGIPGSEPALDLRYVAFRIFCELFETPGATERVLALGSLDGEALLALLGEVDDHVADRVENLSVASHSTKVAESRNGPPFGVAGISHLVRCSQSGRHGAKCGAWGRWRVDPGTVRAWTERPGIPSA